VEQSETSLYPALFDLAGAISGRTDLHGLCSALAQTVRSGYVCVTLGDTRRTSPHRHGNSLDGTNEAPAALGNTDEPGPTGWVWTQQRPLVISPPMEPALWPEAVEWLRTAGLDWIVLLPLTAGERILGVIGFGSGGRSAPGAAELAFLGRVACEVAVALDSHLTRLELVRERDRMKVLFDIASALVSRLPVNELFAAISFELGKVVCHDVAILSVIHKSTGKLRLYALQLREGLHLEMAKEPILPEGLPSHEAILAGHPIVFEERDFSRFHSPVFERFIKQTGLKVGCSLPLITSNGPIGALELGRTGSPMFTPEEVELAAQIARQVAIAVENSLAFRELTELKDKLATENLYLNDEIRAANNSGNMIGESPAFQNVLRSIHVVAPTGATVLILGETGTGKELVARAIHDLSSRAEKSFVKVNCAAIPASLLESELFGHEKGAFTGAIARKMGRFELAHQGTLFLDEVGEIPLELQSKLLRAVQEQEFERLGSNHTTKVDVRLVAATNRDLKAMVDAGTFRSDLYYRLHVVPLTVPPLRDRREDIPLLVRYFAQKYAHQANHPINSIPSSALDLLARYDWPGNIRELQNVIERSVILSQRPVLEIALPELQTAAGEAPRSPADAAKERERILHALEAAEWVVGGPQGAAARLGVKRTTLQSRMKKLDISRQYR
jgi:formate hydrogenlyase transcriptional activator